MSTAFGFHPDVAHTLLIFTAIDFCFLIMLALQMNIIILMIIFGNSGF